MARQQRRWKLLLPIFAMLAAFGGFWSAPAASAADGFDVSNMTLTHGIATGVSQDGFKVCVVWSQFDVESPQAWVRVLNVLDSTWSPPLGSTAFQVSSASDGTVGSTRCAFDSNGNLHVAWHQKSGGSLQVAHRYQSPNGQWSSIAVVAGNGDNPDLAADDDGRVWLVHRKFPGEVYLYRWQNGWDFVTSFAASTSEGGGDPRVGVDNPGYVHVAYKNGQSSRGYAFYNSNNGQKSSEIGIPGSNNAGNFSLAVNRDNGDVHVAYAKDTNNVYYARKSGLGSTSFSNQVVIASGSSVYNAQIAYAGGQVVVVFDNNNKERIDQVISNDQGGSWSSSSTLANPSGQDQAPWIVGAVNGSSYIAYAHSGSVYFTSIIGLLPPALRCAGFADVHKDGPACPAITSLVNSGVINGFATNPPTFGPNVTVQRAQISAFLVRGRGWGTMPTGPKSFTDFGSLVGELRDASLILANACTDPNSPLTCVARGYGDGRFGPNDGVTYAQAISFVARAFTYDSTWVEQPNGPDYYGNVPPIHRTDIRTYNFYAGQLPAGLTTPTSENGWNQPAPRAWVAVVIYQALQSIP